MASFEWHRLTEIAAVRAGASDTRCLDQLAGLEVLCGDLATMPLTPEGSRLMQSEVIRILAQRLRCEQAVEAGHNGDERDDDPEWVVIVGLPRTGSTLLHNLMAASPATSTVPLWRALYPACTEAGEADQARERTEQQLWLMDRLSPRLRRAHPMEADWPEECITLQCLTGASEKFLICADLPAYTRWLAGADMTASYRVLGELTRACVAGATRVVLKAPSHLPYLDDLLRAFPGARVIWTHRDPAAVTASYASLIAAVHQLFVAEVDLESIGRTWVRRLAEHLQDALKAREHLDHLDYLDVHYDSLVADPLGELAGIYGWLGWEPPGGEETRWFDAHRDAGAGHAYPPATVPDDTAEAVFGQYRRLLASVTAAGG